MRIEINKNDTIEQILSKFSQNLTDDHGDKALTITTSRDVKDKQDIQISSIQIAEYIINVLKKAEIENLKLENLYLDDQVLETLKTQLKNEKVLKKISLSNNKITDEGATILAEVLEENKSIESVTISYNLLSNKGLNEIIKALSNNLQISILDFSYNSEINNISILGELKNNSKISWLDFEGCSIKLLGKEVLEFLQQSNLSIFDISNNKLDLTEVASKLVKVLESGVSTSIDLTDMYFLPAALELLGKYDNVLHDDLCIIEKSN